jgi:ABC-type uncharacterized transport system involved in gliding motility auxiliary subunit
MKPGPKTLAAVLLLAALLLVNFLAARLPLRLDATEQRIYTLSPGTRALLAKIEEPVVLDFYFSRHAEGLPISYKNFAERVGEMLRQYRAAARGQIVLNVIHPRPDTPEEERAARAGLQPQLVPGTGEQVYFGLVVTQADAQQTLPAFNPQREQFLEYDLSQLIHAVQQFEKPRLGLLTSLPLQAGPMNPMLMMQQRTPPPDQLVINEWSRSFEIVPVSPTATALPADLDVLAVIHPQNLEPALLHAIDQFLLAGRPVFLALDPASQHFKRQGGQQAMFGGPIPNVSSDLPELLAAWGLDYDAQQVVGDPLLATQVQTGAGTLVRHPVWLSLPAQALDANAPPTAQLNSLLFIEAGHVALAPETTGLTFTPLITTTPQSGDVPAFTLTMAQPEDLYRQLLPEGPRTLAALVTGTFPTAFPNGPPATTNDDNAPDSKIENPKSKIQTPLSSGRGTLLVVTDTDFLFDDYSVRRFNFLGVQAAEPLNDNLAFAANALEFLGGSSDLLAIRGKGGSLRPFTVVREMEVVAQQRYQQELAALEARLGDVQRQLSDLQARAGEGNRLVASPEVQQAIEDFQAEEAAMRRERREIRRALREDINALKTRLLLLNLLAGPVLIGAFGLWFHRTRRPIS